MRSRPRTTRTRAALAAAVATAVMMTGCSSGGDAATDETSRSAGASTSGSVYDASIVHAFALEIEDDDFDQVIAAYEDTGEKEWITATVTIDGETFEDVGLRLKGNSSLMSVSSDAEPTDLPWLIDLGKYVDGQDLDGYSEFVVRSNTTESALNEAVALDLLEQAGLASEHVVASRFSVNGGEEKLRLVVQNLDGDWDEENFDTEGVLYKAESGGDYSYRGDDPSAYEDVFDQETDADEENLEPLIEFLDFINNSDDATFAAELGDHLDVEAFATYLAFEDLIGNTDDIDGPGNNSYLRYDEESGSFTVVAWDHNLAFGGFGMMGGGPGRDGEMPEGFEPPEGMELPEGFEPPEGMELPEDFDPGELPEGFERGGDGDGARPGFGSNILVERFKADEELNALYEQALADLEEQLFTSGTAQEVLDEWVAVLSDQAGDLIDAETLDAEAADIEAALEDPGSAQSSAPGDADADADDKGRSS